MLNFPPDLSSIGPLGREKLMFQGFHVYACAEATVERLVMNFIGDHLGANPRNPSKFHQNRMEIVEVMRVARIPGQTDTKPKLFRKV